LFYLQEKAERGQQSEPLEQEIKKTVAAEPSAYPRRCGKEYQEGLRLHQMP
jgi:hypothetical protein